MWRFGFNHAEKLIIKHADGTLSPGDIKTCRKAVLRLLKEDLEEASLAGDIQDMCSYFVKTTMLHEYDRLSERMHWERRPRSNTLRVRYVDALESLIKSLEEKKIMHYFIPGENLLPEGWHQQADKLKRKLQKKADRYR